MNRPLPSVLLTAVTLAGLVTALPVAAQFAKPEDAIKYRKAGMTMMAAHFGRVAAMANGRAPFDAKAAAENAEIATALSKLPYAGFIAGTDKGDTKAKSEIWTEADKFRAAAARRAACVGQIALGVLYPASCARTGSLIACSSNSASLFRCTTAVTASPHFSSGTPTTNASAMAEWVLSTSSTSSG
mgnify:CR=1 FL=1